MKETETYVITSKSARQKEARRELVNSINQSGVISSVVSSSDNWILNSVYNLTPEETWDISSRNQTILCRHILNEFARKDVSSIFHFNHVIREQENYFLLSWRNIFKEDGFFRLSQAVLVNYTLLDISMIKAGNYLFTTTPQDLSRYSDFFDVHLFKTNSNKFSNLKNDYENGKISKAVLDESLDILERERTAILSLKK